MTSEKPAPTNGTIDLRSDTVTRPTSPMLDAMMQAEVGDDVWGDDPTVLALEARVAAECGKQAAMFAPSGTQANLAGLMAHCARGDEYIVGDHAHTYRYEAGGAAVLGSIQPQPVRMLESGMLDLDHVQQVVKPDDPHFARSRLLCLENTHDGKAIPLQDMAAAADLAAELGLAMHLDGARMFNAVVALDSSAREIAALFDTVSICLSKGLGAPVGSVLAGSDQLIASARRARKMLGGAMRQSGFLAAAGLYALDHHVDRLATDHANAETLATGLGAIDGVEVTGTATNMVFLEIAADGSVVEQRLHDQGILCSFSGSSSRMVTHLDVSPADIGTVVAAMADVMTTTV